MSRIQTRVDPETGKEFWVDCETGEWDWGNPVVSKGITPGLIIILILISLLICAIGTAFLKYISALILGAS